MAAVLDHQIKRIVHSALFLRNARRNFYSNAAQPGCDPRRLKFFSQTRKMAENEFWRACQQLASSEEVMPEDLYAGKDRLELF